MDFDCNRALLLMPVRPWICDWTGVHKRPWQLGRESLAVFRWPCRSAKRFAEADGYVIAIFVYLAAETEAQGSELQAISAGTSVSDVMITDFATLGPRACVGEAVELLLATSQSEFPVLNEAGRFEGLMTREGIVQAMRERGAGAPVITVMRRDIPMVDSQSPIDASVRLMQEASTSAVPVVDRNQRVVGLMNYETIGELLMLRNADGHFRPRGRVRRSR